MKPLLRSLLLLGSTLLLAAPIPRGALRATDDCNRTDSRTPQEPKAMTKKLKITTFLWFDNNAEEAVRFYMSIFKDGNILEEARWGEGGPVPKGALMTARFQLLGQEFMALNGGPLYRFNEAISLFVDCENQQQVDELWEKLGAGGEPGRCGWLKDKYGLSWQVVPTVLGEMMRDKDPAKSKRVVDAMLLMGKLDIKRLQQAYEGR
ncbi:MAG TPA: VOC family protein [Planctomycetota bacterium]|nr:VOC family protein [Planctomycetota bacterium]